MDANMKKIFTTIFIAVATIAVIERVPTIRVLVKGA